MLTGVIMLPRSLNNEIATVMKTMVNADMAGVRGTAITAQRLASTIAISASELSAAALTKTVKVKIESVKYHAVTGINL